MSSLPPQPRLHSLRLPLEGNQPVPEVQSVAEWSRRRTASMPAALRRQAEADVRVEEVVVTEVEVCVPTETNPISTRGSEALAEPAMRAAPVLEPPSALDRHCHLVELADGQSPGISAATQRTDTRPLPAVEPAGRSPATQHAASVVSPRDSPVAQKPQPPRTPTVAVGLHQHLHRNSGRGCAGGSLFSPSETATTLTPPGNAPSLGGSPPRRPTRLLSPRARGSMTSRAHSLPHSSAHGRLQDAVPVAVMSSPSRRPSTPSCATGHGQSTSISFASSPPPWDPHLAPGGRASQLHPSLSGRLVGAPPLLPLMPLPLSAEHVSQQQRMSGDCSNIFRSASYGTLVHPVQSGCFNQFPR